MDKNAETRIIFFPKTNIWKGGWSVALPCLPLPQRHWLHVTEAVEEASEEELGHQFVGVNAGAQSGAAVHTADDE